MISQFGDSTLKGRTTNILKPKTNRRLGEPRRGPGIPIESIVVSLGTGVTVAFDAGANSTGQEYWKGGRQLHFTYIVQDHGDHSL